MDFLEYFFVWNKLVLNVLVIKKVMDLEVIECFKEFMEWLVEVYGLILIFLLLMVR